MKVRITSFARPDDSFLQHVLPRYAFGKKSWKDLEFVSDDSYDWLVILSSPNKETLEQGYDYKKAVTFLTEPPESYNRVAYPTSLVCPMYLPQPFWPINVLQRASANHFSSKKELLSAVTSGLTGLTGHKLRLELLKSLDKIVEDGLDIYGNSIGNPLFNELVNYKGAIPQKYEALWPYKYHFACENSFHQDYFTEKIVDPVVCDCLCFYDGCRNLEEFIDERAFIRIDVNNVAQSIEMIVKAIDNEEWEKRIHVIQNLKDRFLHHLNPLNIIWMTLHGKDTFKECKL